MTEKEKRAAWYRQRAKDPAWLEKRKIAARDYRRRLKLEATAKSMEPMYG